MIIRDGFVSWPFHIFPLWSIDTIPIDFKLSFFLWCTFLETNRSIFIESLIESKVEEGSLAVEGGLCLPENLWQLIHANKIIINDHHPNIMWLNSS